MLTVTIVMPWCEQERRAVSGVMLTVKYLMLQIRRSFGGKPIDVYNKSYDAVLAAVEAMPAVSLQMPEGGLRPVAFCMPTVTTSILKWQLD